MINPSLPSVGYNIVRLRLKAKQRHVAFSTIEESYSKKYSIARKLFFSMTTLLFPGSSSFQNEHQQPFKIKLQMKF